MYTLTIREQALVLREYGSGRHAVLHERGQVTPNVKPDPVDAQWIARDKFQDERNAQRARWL